MKKLFMLSFLLILIYCNVNAQLKMDGNGQIAVGDASATPGHLLYLIGGDINTSTDKGYLINNEYVLRNNSHPEDIFVGVDAGNNTMTGHYSTFIGNSAGHANTTGQYNSFIGYASGYSNTTGFSNTALGHTAMVSNTTGQHNTSIGYSTGNHNTTGSYNTSIGSQAGHKNTTGYDNVFIGINAGYENTSGSFNTVLGGYAGQSNSIGGYNTCIGYYAGQSTTSGSLNTYLGYYAGQGNQTGGYNTCIGYYAGQSNVSGSNNTYLGYNANGNANNYTNSTAIGNGAIFTNNNQIKIGNANVEEIGGVAGWDYISDGRFKINIQENVKGLEFINRLRPITYNLNTKQLDDFLIQNMPDSIKTLHQSTMNFVSSTAKIHSGFIAQEVDSVANLCGFVSSIVHAPVNNTDPYSMNYSEIVVPLVKAVQELSKKVDTLQILNALQQNKLNQMQNDLMACCGKPIIINKMGMNDTSGQGNIGNTIHIELASIDQIILYQNEPNPFNGSTVIRYFIPENLQLEANIVFYDAYGKEIKKVEIKEKGTGKIEANAQNLAAGIYSYSLIVNDKIVDTKKMMKNK